MENQWHRQKFMWPSKKRMFLLYTATIQPQGTQPCSGMCSTQEKVHSSSSEPRRTTRRKVAEALKPHMIKDPAPSTCRKPLCRSQTRLCTTVLWVTQCHKLQGELSTNSEKPRKPNFWSSAWVSPFFTVWAMFPNISLDDENFTNGQSRVKVGDTAAGFHWGNCSPRTSVVPHGWLHWPYRTTRATMKWSVVLIFINNLFSS